MDFSVWTFGLIYQLIWIFLIDHASVILDALLLPLMFDYLLLIPFAEYYCN